MGKAEQQPERSDETRKLEAAKERDRYRQAEDDKKKTARIEKEKQKDRQRDR